jgi:NADH pyrophosphatase NudC (nudix superfamily)
VPLVGVKSSSGVFPVTARRHSSVKLMLDAVIAVIIKGDKVLLIQRAPGIRGGGYWAPVSGEVEVGESQEAAVAREVMEEVGLTVRPVRKVWENVSTRGTFLLHWWIAEYVGGELALNLAEASDARWLTVDEICRLDGTFDGDRAFYQKILPLFTP